MDTPIVCTLGPQDQAERRQELAALGRRALRSRTPIEGGERLVFQAGDDVEARLREVVAAESRCCAFLTFDLRRHDGTVTLDITGAPPAGPVIAALFA